MSQEQFQLPLPSVQDRDNEIRPALQVIEYLALSPNRAALSLPLDPSIDQKALIYQRLFSHPRTIPRELPSLGQRF